jgi:hypothetical protein
MRDYRGIVTNLWTADERGAAAGAAKPRPSALKKRIGTCYHIFRGLSIDECVEYPEEDCTDNP